MILFLSIVLSRNFPSSAILLDLYDYCFWIIVVTLQELLRDAFSKMIHSFVDVDNSAPAATKVLQKMVSSLTWSVLF